MPAMPVGEVSVLSGQSLQDATAVELGLADRWRARVNKGLHVELGRVMSAVDQQYLTFGHSWDETVDLDPTVTRTSTTTYAWRMGRPGQALPSLEINHRQGELIYPGERLWVDPNFRGYGAVALWQAYNQLEEGVSQVIGCRVLSGKEAVMAAEFIKSRTSSFL